MASAEHFRGRTVVVTGGTGFIGSHLVERLVEAGVNLRVIGRRDASTWHPLEEIRARVEYFQGDLQDPTFVEKASHGADALWHLAASVGGIGHNVKHPALLFHQNVIPGIQTLEGARRAGLKKFLMVSSACVYPRDARVPTPEEDGFLRDPETGNLGYGWGKRALEVAARLWAQEYGMHVVIARAFNGYGPRDDFSPETSHVIPALIRKVLAPGDELLVWGDGSATRSFVYVDDFVEGLVRAAIHAPSATAINIGTHEEIAIGDLSRLVLEICGSAKRIRFDPSKPSGQPRRACDTTKAEAMIGYRASISLREGLTRTLAWLREHPEALS